MKNMLILFLVLGLLQSCNKNSENDFDESKYQWYEIEVTATAYNSFKNQTNSNPNITAFGDSLYPGLPYIAVSRDLYRKGLRRDTPIKINGFDSIYWVKDRMHSRWQNRIDIYMGVDLKAAREWGRRRVKIQYGIIIPDSTKKTDK
ncbi:3D domain-containing protein [Paucihalobacter ruber]|uniref:3D domain-containing protein n=1 Tax=Paucihalobacter ruber TaxID=2567861 RepID=UPI001FEA9538|nr:3D domain-containing protein [Paucihalobacter ruber]